MNLAELHVAMPNPSPVLDGRLVEALAEPDGMPGVAEPWTLLPSQQDATQGGSGERRLMAAVLADGIRLYVKLARAMTPGGRALFRDTERWIEDRSREELYAYESICDVLGIDSEQLRLRLRAIAASGIATTIPFDAGRVRIGRPRKVRV